MSDGPKVFSALNKSLQKYYPTITGHAAAHLNTML